MATARVADRAVLGPSLALFAVSAVLTVFECASMSAMPSMRMPGGWTMSMTWMRMPGQSWPGAAAAFAGMWLVMMAAMMTPSLIPMLARYRRALSRSGDTRLALRTVSVGAGYFAVWGAVGVAAFPLGVMVAAATMTHPALARMVPAATGVVLVLAGALQLTPWKSRALACCRAEHAGRAVRADVGAAWRHGLRLGLCCVRCCAGLTAVLMVLGVMDLRTMAAVTIATTLERVTPAGDRIARATGVLLVAIGLLRTLAG